MNSNTLTKKDFASSTEVKWCPGCGDYAILSSLQSVLAETGLPKENIVCVSGIGCSSRLPHYMSTFGFHTIHGRAPAVATGLKLANPELSVWVITGDGDGLSIGGNHLLHALRRNVGLKIVLFNNKIYGLTKGQASPTSNVGTKTKSTPFGSLDPAINPVNFALSLGTTFVARTVATDPRHMQEVLLAAHQHEGTAFVEVLQNCVIFNDKVHAHVTATETKDDNQLRLVHGQPLLYGTNKDKSFRFNQNTMELEPINIAQNKESALIHNERSTKPFLQILLAEMTSPTALGVFRNVDSIPYEQIVTQQIEQVTSIRGKGDLHSLLYSGDVWTI